MANDLIELHERIAIARTEINLLGGMVQDFSNIGLHGHVETSTLGGDVDDLYISQSRPIPLAIRSKAGTIANEIRSCLDALACVLALRHSGSTKGTYFPISKSEVIFNDDGMKKIRMLSTADRAVIVGLKPYSGGHPVLFGLHEADRSRKHIRLGGCSPTNANMVFGGGFHIGSGQQTFVNCTFNGVHVRFMEYFGAQLVTDVGVRVLIARGVPKNLQWEASVAIAYSDPPDLKAKPLVPTLIEFADVADGVIGLFD